MSKRLLEIARRKQSLIDRASRERAELSAAYEEIRSPFDVTATLFSIGRILKTHPIIAAGVSSFLVSGYAGKLLKSTGEFLKLWRLAPLLWIWWKSRPRR